MAWGGVTFFPLTVVWWQRAWCLHTCRTKLQHYVQKMLSSLNKNGDLGFKWTMLVNIFHLFTWVGQLSHSTHVQTRLPGNMHLLQLLIWRTFFSLTLQTMPFNVTLYHVFGYHQVLIWFHYALGHLFVVEMTLKPLEILSIEEGGNKTKTKNQLILLFTELPFTWPPLLQTRLLSTQFTKADKFCLKPFTFAHDMQDNLALPPSTAI